MSAGTYHIKIEQGATFALNLTYKDETGALVNLSGYTARMQGRRRADDDATVFSLTSGAGITLGGALGTIDIGLTATETGAMNPVEGVYDLELVSGAVVDRILKGTFVVEREITR
jgi:hypothetical protein|tara:strand:- start:811 stop:1155 length:345 start_codon:yes stop_codon:yes gene_type:complete